MNKLVIGLVIGSILLVGVVVFYASQQKSSPLPSSQQQSMTNPNDSEQQSQPAQNNTSSYVVYTPQLLEEAKNKKRVLFFYASWCPTCIPADEAFQAHTDKIPSDVTLIRVNYNDPETDADEKALAQKYGITYQHTFVQIDEQGNQVAKWNGGQIDELLTNVK